MLGPAPRSRSPRVWRWSLGWVEKLLRQRRRAGHIKPLGHRGGAPRRLDERAVEAVRTAVTAQPDIALEELRRRR